MKHLALLASISLIAADAEAQVLDNNAARQLSLQLRQKAQDLADQRCLAGREISSQNSVSFLAGLRSFIRAVTGGLTFAGRQRVIRGAIDAPASVRVAADAAIRACLERQTPLIEASLLSEARQASGATVGTGFYPPVIDVRFTYRRNLSLDPAKYSENLRVNFIEGGRVRPSLNIASQSDPAGSPYFFYTYAPFPTQRVEGAIAAKPLDSRLTADQAPRAKICFERVPAPPPPPPGADMFNCVEGDVCRPVGQTRGWLRTCAGVAQINTGPLGQQYAQVESNVATDARPMTNNAPRWVTPSVDTLTAQPGEQVGWTYFKLRTDAFRKPDITGIELALSVNGVPVDEDGLTPAQRPEPNDPSQPFDAFFALQTLNFEGRDSGCDTISVSLTPLLADGGRGTPLTTHLLYTALRNQPNRTEQSGDATLTWSATVIRPAREWRHWAFLNSYAFRTDDMASKRTVTARIEADKNWLDRQHWTYGGAQIRGVVRPPLTIRQGSAAFGLAVGLVQPSGQVRFTFSEAEARAIGQSMIRRRSANAEAGRIINPQPYIYQAPSGGVTPAGICTRA